MAQEFSPGKMICYHPQPRPQKTPFRPGRKRCHIQKLESMLRFRDQERAKAAATRGEYWERMTKTIEPFLSPFPDFEEEQGKAN